MNNNNQRGKMIALKLPKSTMNFVKNNPKIAEIAGMMLVKFQIAKQHHDAAVNLFLDGTAFEAFLTEGTTKEELKEFLKAGIEAVNDNKMTDMGEGTVQDFENLMGEAKKVLGEDRVVSTRVGFPEKPKDSKEGPSGNVNSSLN